MVADRDELAMLAEACRRQLDLTAELGEAYRYAHLSLCVLDAVYSIGVRYEGTVAVVRRYAEWAGLRLSRPHGELPPTEDQQPLGDFIGHIDSLGVDRFAEEVARNRQRTSSRSGILKAEASLRFAQALQGAGVHTLQDVAAAAADEDLDAAIRRIPGHSSGIAAGYFFMLAGDDNLVKPDRMILRYLTGALGRSVTVGEAAGLIRGACRILSADHPRLTPRSLDYAIWNHQRALPASTSATSRPGRRRRSQASGEAGTKGIPWTTIYDLPRRRVLFVAGTGLGHWSGIEVDPTLSDEHCSVYRDVDGAVVFVEAALDDTGLPIRVPAGFNVDLMGSPTIWLGMVSRYVWRFDNATIVNDDGTEGDPFARYRQQHSAEPSTR